MRHPFFLKDLPAGTENLNAYCLQRQVSGCLVQGLTSLTSLAWHLCLQLYQAGSKLLAGVAGGHAATEQVHWLLSSHLCAPDRFLRPLHVACIARIASAVQQCKAQAISTSC